MEDQTLPQATADEFICEDCNTTTPIHNESCPNCGGKLLPVDAMREPSDHELQDEDLAVDDLHEPGSESLESLAENELNEEQRSYNEDSYGDE